MTDKRSGAERHSVGEALTDIADAVSQTSTPIDPNNESILPDWPDAGRGMSNFDHEIDEGMEEELANNEVIGYHHAWEFCGKVWCDGKQYVEEVWRYKRPIAIVRADTLRELMEKVNNDWGWD